MKLFTKRLQDNVITFVISFIILFVLMIVIFKHPGLIPAYIGVSLYFAVMFTMMRDTTHCMKRNVKLLNKVSESLQGIEEKFDEIINKLEKNKKE